MKPGIEKKKIFFPAFPSSVFVIILFVFTLPSVSCSFDYGQAGESDKSRPDIVMDKLEYVRVRGGDPQVRFRAEHAERWEERQTMELTSFTFEQMEDKGETVNAEGRAGAAVVQIDSGDISLSGGVRIRVDSEDIIIRTSGLEWKDKPKTLSGSQEAEVDIERSDGTSFTGRGFFADARNRTWSFSGEVKGIYVETEEDDESSSEDRSAFEPLWAEQPEYSALPPSQEEAPRTEPAQIPERIPEPPAQEKSFGPGPSLPQAEQGIPGLMEEK